MKPHFLLTQESKYRVGAKRRGIIEYIEYQSVCPFVGIGSPPPPRPSPHTSVSPPPWTQQYEEQHFLAVKGDG
jgi:hypothetical protein